MDIYENLWTYQGHAKNCIVKNVFSWLMCSQEALRSSDFLAVVAVAPDQSFPRVSRAEILDICCNLVVYDATLDVFRLAHLSVREFLEKRPEYSESAINSLAAEVCLLRLLSQAWYHRMEEAPGFILPVETFGSSLNAYVSKRESHVRQATIPPSMRFLEKQVQHFIGTSFNKYPNFYWATHCRLADNLRFDGLLNRLFEYFLFGEVGPESPFSTWTEWVSLFMKYQDPPWELWQFWEIEYESSGVKFPTGPLLVACTFDFPEVIHICATSDTFSEAFSGRLLSEASKFAAIGGNTEAMTVLLKEMPVQVTEQVVIAAVQNEESGVELLTVLLRQCEEEIRQRMC